MGYFWAASGAAPAEGSFDAQAQHFGAEHARRAGENAISGPGRAPRAILTHRRSTLERNEHGAQARSPFSTAGGASGAALGKGLF